jgi:hypothetical protein
MLAGYKTYLVAAATVGYAVLGYMLGYLTQEQVIQLLPLGAGLAALRAAIAKGR